MSFSTDTKNELCRIMPEKKCDQLAEIAGFLRVAGSLGLAGGGSFRISVSTELASAARHYKQLIREYFQVDSAVEIGEGSALSRGHTYILTIGPEQRWCGRETTISVTESTAD